MRSTKLTAALVVIAMLTANKIASADSDGPRVYNPDVPPTSGDFAASVEQVLPPDLQPDHVRAVKCDRIDEQHFLCDAELQFGSQKLKVKMHMNFDQTQGWGMCQRDIFGHENWCN